MVTVCQVVLIVVEVWTARADAIVGARCHKRKSKGARCRDGAGDGVDKQRCGGLNCIFQPVNPRYQAFTTTTVMRLTTSPAFYDREATRTPNRATTSIKARVFLLRRRFHCEVGPLLGFQRANLAATRYSRRHRVQKQQLFLARRALLQSSDPRCGS